MLGKRIGGSGLNMGTSAVELRGFDSAAEQIAVSAKNIGAEQREQQSLIEHVRETAITIVSDLVNAVTDKTLEDGELASDRLDSLIIEAIDEADDDEGTLENAIVESVSDAFLTFGVDDSVINTIFDENVEAADAAIEAAAETVLANMPDDGEPMDALVREFIFGEADEHEDGFDSTVAKNKARSGAFTQRKVNGRKIAYRGVLAIRKGKKTVVNKRLPGQKIKLSAAQKAGQKKMRLRAYTPNAIKKRVRSFNKGRKMGLY
ncbi:hypothetical protein [Acinetobacter chinensis]|uniref:hypothetical protein n=1 Tax=Acinetobacter chinensis TaxID=2004650 RepID=UPI002934F506|nr:hypothetical protein [Acinetobacter chinensis]WOE40056.1 hypothetical protein QSG87_09030 [Acinetobacter chinensis]